MRIVKFVPISKPNLVVFAEVNNGTLYFVETKSWKQHVVKITGTLEGIAFLGSKYCFVGTSKGILRLQLCLKDYISAEWPISHSHLLPKEIIDVVEFLLCSEDRLPPEVADLIVKQMILLF